MKVLCVDIEVDGMILLIVVIDFYFEYWYIVYIGKVLLGDFNMFVVKFYVLGDIVGNLGVMIVVVII